ncbi:MAG: primosomal protein N' [Clostridiales bacterium]|nr:primosomal protein N' [Clostridiales bacterium]
MKFAGVIVDITNEKLNREFTYLIPERFSQVLRIGMQVIIPFGKSNRRITGYVVEIRDSFDGDVSTLKEIAEIEDRGNAIEGRLIELARWMSERYGSTLIQALKTVIPAREKIKELTRRTVELLVPREEANKALLAFYSKNQKARARLIDALLSENPLSMDKVKGELNISKSVLDKLSEMGLIRVLEERVYRNPIENMIRNIGESGELEETSRRILTPEQERALSIITDDMKSGRKETYLIHGVTGSGKTEVYIRAIEEVIRNRGQAIVLIPEISLTYQTVMRFYRRFPGRVSVMHSRLSKGERYDQYIQAKEGRIDVMIGPRSALFTPFPNLKLIVIDEEHESSYKSDTSPRYHARETAIHRGEMENASVILGSATPSMEAYSRALNGEYKLIRLENRALGGQLPQVSIVDMRQELKKGNRSMFSLLLQEKISERLIKQEQVMLFLNRRGYSGFIACRECGHVFKCPHCDVSMSSHVGRKLICHYCGYKTSLPVTCPLCGSEHIGGFKAGTEQIELLLKKSFPEAKVIRMDLDTTRDKDSYNRILSAFAEHKADILVGTQMIVKGHDFPNVTLMGILSADMSLFGDDYRCGERTFQLLTQAAGRSGRGSKAGEVVIQTYHPEHYAVRLAIDQDYESFYEEEESVRRLMKYPPFIHMLSVTVSGTSEEYTEMAAGYIASFTDRYCSSYQVVRLGPGTPGVAKVKDHYYKVLYYKHTDYDILIKIKNRILAYVEVNEGFRNLNIQLNFE